MTSREGTKIWCPFCQDWRTCSALSPKDAGKPDGERKIPVRGFGIFRRGRQCQRCRKKFVTSEVADLNWSALDDEVKSSRGPEVSHDDLTDLAAMLDSIANQLRNR